MFADSICPDALLRPLLRALCASGFDARVLRRQRLSALKTLASRTLVVGCVGLTSCTYLDRARRVSDAAVEATQRVALQTVVEAQVERERLRRLRCVDPILTPATISNAAMDPRLGQPWVEELLRDCPVFSAFLTETVATRLTLAKLIASSPSLSTLVSSQPSTRGE